MKRKIVHMLCCLMLCFALLPCTAQAAELDCVELMAMDQYWAGAHLFGTSRTLYKELVDYILDVYSGVETSRVFETEIYAGGNGYIDEAAILDAVRQDYPLESCWIKNCSSGFTYYENTGYYKFRFHFLPYPNDTWENDSAIDISQVPINTVVSNAEAIIEKYANLGDYEKLVAYFNEICALVRYDHDAAKDKSDPNHKDVGTAHGIINVFDGDSNTNVVCEGYARAFHYLCSISDFEGDVHCYYVVGKFYSLKSDLHAWNIVTMPDGKNYLVDVTHSDGGLEGDLSIRFLKGGTLVKDGYYKIESPRSTVGYEYHEMTDYIWGVTDVLELSETDYIDTIMADVTVWANLATVLGDRITPLGKTYTAKLNVGEKLELPETITVTVGGQIITGYNWENGVITIPGELVTGDIEITVDVTCLHEWVGFCGDVVWCDICDLIDETATDHIWQKATCTASMYCTRCGLENGGPLGHNWQAATCIAPRTCARCLVTEGEKSDHHWQTATCKAPKTCSDCKLTDGEIGDHIWKEGNCTTPKTCTVCQITDGDPVHIWVDQTCTSSAYCSMCLAKGAEALGHDWQEATCIDSMRCSRCKKGNGLALGHNYDKTSVVWTGNTTASAHFACTRCDHKEDRTCNVLVMEESDYILVRASIWYCGVSAYADRQFGIYEIDRLEVVVPELTEAVFVVVAGYDNRGRMVDVWTKTTTGGLWMPEISGNTYRMFILDNQQAPLFSSITPYYPEGVE